MIYLIRKQKCPFLRKGEYLNERYLHTQDLYIFYPFPNRETSLTYVATQQFTPFILDAPYKPRTTTVDKSRPRSLIEFEIKSNKQQPTLQARSNFGLWYTPCILALILQL